MSAQVSDRLSEWHEACRANGLTLAKLNWIEGWAHPQFAEWTEADGETFVLYADGDEGFATYWIGDYKDGDDQPRPRSLVTIRQEDNNTFTRIVPLIFDATRRIRERRVARVPWHNHRRSP